MRTSSGHGRTRAALGVLFPALLACVGCVRNGMNTLMDDFVKSPDAQRLMNEAVDRFLEQADLGDLQSKTVGLRAGAYAEEGGFPHVLDGLGRLPWTKYLDAGLERKISGLGARCSTNNPDLWVVVTKNTVGLHRRIYAIPFLMAPFIDLYQHKLYWAEFDATVDMKSGDLSRVLKTQRIRTVSHDEQVPAMFAISLF